VPAMAILLAVLLMPLQGIEPLVWGTLIGFVLHVFMLATPLAKTKELELPQLSSNSPLWSKFWQGFGIMLLGTSLASFNSVIDQFFAAHSAPGAITTLSYANRIMSLILGLGATAVSRATLPVFSRMKTQNSQQVKQVAMFWVRLMLVMGTFTALICWWLAPWIVQILFERGAFSIEDTKIVSEVFCYGLTQVPFYFSAMTFVTLLASQGRYGLIAVSGATNLFVKASANYLLVPVFGVNAIMISSGIMYFVSLLLLYLFSSVFLKNLN
jgi:putative peptidoglycan lipid II flippase